MMNLCGKSQDNEYYIDPTNPGKVFYDLPENYDSKLLEEMDQIIATLELKNQ